MITTGRPPVLPTAEEQRSILSVLVGEVTVAAVARWGWLFGQAAGTGQRQFLEAGTAGGSEPSTRGAQLQGEVTDLTSALGGAAVGLRVGAPPASRGVPPVR